MNNAPHIRRLAGAMLLWSLALHASAQLVISEAKPSGDEWIEVRNQGNTSVDLAGFTLADDLEDASPWVLPSMTLDAQARVILNAPFQLSAGEVVTLRSPQEDLVDALPIHPELPLGSFRRAPRRKPHRLVHVRRADPRSTQPRDMLFWH